MLDQTPRQAQPLPPAQPKKPPRVFVRTKIEEVRMTATVTGTDIAIRLLAA